MAEKIKCKPCGKGNWAPIEIAIAGDKPPPGTIIRIVGKRGKRAMLRVIESK